jgi:CRP-like cAMP-binding protein
MPLFRGWRNAIIKQGEISDTAYIIKTGTCVLVVEKSGNFHPVSHLGKGEIIGMVSLLTGEPQHVHFEAETDMELWELNKELFDDISRQDPAWLDFLTGFRNEAKTIANLNHDNIINVFDIEEQFRTVFIIQELIEGESLNDLLNRLGIRQVFSCYTKTPGKRH